MAAPAEESMPHTRVIVLLLWVLQIVKRGSQPFLTESLWFGSVKV